MRNRIILLVALVASIFGLSSNQTVMARLLNEDRDSSTSLTVKPYVNTDAAFIFECDNGGATTNPTPATLTSQVRGCSCYTATGSSKVGAIKINVNGTDQWIRTYDNPN